MDKLYIPKIACASPESLSDRLSAAPIRVLESGQAHERGYMVDGAIVPVMDERRPLTVEELEAIAVPLGTIGAIELVRVPARHNELLRHVGGLARVGMVTTTESPARTISTTRNKDNGYSTSVGMHIDIPWPGQRPNMRLMGVASGGDRGLVFCPSVRRGAISEHLWNAATSDECWERREQIRQGAREAQTEGMPCYILRVDGSGPESLTRMAYINFDAAAVLHDGTAVDADAPSTVQLWDTDVIMPGVFESVI